MLLSPNQAEEAHGRNIRVENNVKTFGVLPFINLTIAQSITIVSLQTKKFVALNHIIVKTLIIFQRFMNS